MKSKKITSSAINKVASVSKDIEATMTNDPHLISIPKNLTKKLEAIQKEIEPEINLYQQLQARMKELETEIKNLQVRSAVIQNGILEAHDYDCTKIIYEVDRDFQTITITGEK